MAKWTRLSTKTTRSSAAKLTSSGICILRVQSGWLRALCESSFMINKSPYLFCSMVVKVKEVRL